MVEERPLVDWPEIPDSRQQVQDIEYLAPASSGGAGRGPISRMGRPGIGTDRTYWVNMTYSEPQAQAVFKPCAQGARSGFVARRRVHARQLDHRCHSKGSSNLSHRHLAGLVSRLYSRLHSVEVVGSHHHCGVYGGGSDSWFARAETPRIPIESSKAYFARQGPAVWGYARTRSCGLHYCLVPILRTNIRQ